MRPFLLLLLLGIGCADPPTAPTLEPDPLRQSAEDAAVQRRLAGSAAWMDDGLVRVVWAFYDTAYRLEAHTAAEGLVQWEDGEWWIGRDEVEALALIVDRHDGAILQRDLSWRPMKAYRYPLPLLLLGRSLDDPGLQIRLGSGRALYIYHLAPLDSLEALKNGPGD